MKIEYEKVEGESQWRIMMCGVCVGRLDAIRPASKWGHGQKGIVGYSIHSSRYSICEHIHCSDGLSKAQARKRAKEKFAELVEAHNMLPWYSIPIEREAKVKVVRWVQARTREEAECLDIDWSTDDIVGAIDVSRFGRGRESEDVDWMPVFRDVASQPVVTPFPHKVWGTFRKEDLPSAMFCLTAKKLGRDEGRDCDGDATLERLRGGGRVFVHSSKILESCADAELANMSLSIRPAFMVRGVMCTAFDLKSLKRVLSDGVHPSDAVVMKGWPVFGRHEPKSLDGVISWDGTDVLRVERGQYTLSALTLRED